MVQQSIHNDAEIRRFLLGEMSETERSAFEAQFVANENLFEQISAAEDELIESYVRGTLSPAEKTIFEREFLSTESRRRRVAFMQTLFGKIKKETEIVAAKKTEAVDENPSVWTSLANFLKTPKLAFGSAFALLLLIFGGWFLLRNSNQPELARQITPTPTAETTAPVQNRNSTLNQNDADELNTKLAENSPADKSASTNVNKATSNANRNSNLEKQNAPAPAPVLALFSGIVRSEGKMPALNLPKNAPGANFQLNLESVDYKTYSVEIINPDGSPIFKNSKLKVRNSKINFFVPAGKLPTGDYLVKLSALNPQSENESVADYAFRVNRK